MITTLLLAAFLQTGVATTSISTTTSTTTTPSTTASFRKELRAPAQRLADEYQRFEEFDRRVNAIDRQLQGFLRGRIVLEGFQPPDPDPRVQFAGSQELAKTMVVILDQYVAVGSGRINAWTAATAAANAFDAVLAKAQRKMTPQELAACQTWREQFRLTPERLNVRAFDQRGNRIPGMEGQFIPTPPATTTTPLIFSRSKPDAFEKK